MHSLQFKRFQGRFLNWERIVSLAQREIALPPANPNNILAVPLIPQQLSQEIVKLFFFHFPRLHNDNTLCMYMSKYTCLCTPRNITPTIFSYQTGHPHKIKHFNTAFLPRSLGWSAQTSIHPCYHHNNPAR